MRKQVIWITGASSGIGRALALFCYNKGHHVIISARSTDKLEALANEMDPDRVKVLPLDLDHNQEATFWASEAVDWKGRVDILINNGGMGHMGTVEEMQMEVERKVLEVNFWGSVALTKAILPHMRERGSGQIWSIASILGHFGSPKLAAYAASKFAVVGYFESLQYELRRSGVHVGIVSPGFVNTNVTLSSLGPDGDPIGVNSPAQEKGMRPEVFAAKFYGGMKRNRPPKHLIIGGYETFAVPFKKWLPRLFFAVYGKLTDVTRSKSAN